MKLRSYCFASVALICASVGFAAFKKNTFFEGTIYLSQSKINIAIWGNFVFMLAVVLSQTFKVLFFGTLNNDEIQKVIENSKWAIIDTCLALTIFREDLDMSVVFMFMVLMFAKMFHWISSSRIDSVGHIRDITTIQHLRINGFLFFLLLFDFTIALYLILETQGQPGVSALFAFEFLILSVSMIQNGFKYMISCVDTSHDSRWLKKVVCVFWVNFIHDILNLIFYTCFFVMICLTYGMPLYLFRELYMVYSTLRKGLSEYLIYRRLIKNMNQRFPDVRGDEFGENDRTCIICREEMMIGKKLPCSHTFHFECLRNWFERQHTCPTCRANIPIDAVVAPVLPRAPVVPVAAGAAPAGVPARPYQGGLLPDRQVRVVADAAAGGGIRPVRAVGPFPAGLQIPPGPQAAPVYGQYPPPGMMFTHAGFGHPQQFAPVYPPLYRPVYAQNVFHRQVGGNVQNQNGDYHYYTPLNQNQQPSTVQPLRSGDTQEFQHQEPTNDELKSKPQLQSSTVNPSAGLQQPILANQSTDGLRQPAKPPTANPQQPIPVNNGLVDLQQPITGLQQVTSSIQPTSGQTIPYPPVSGPQQSVQTEQPVAGLQQPILVNQPAAVIRQPIPVNPGGMFAPPGILYPSGYFPPPQIPGVIIPRFYQPNFWREQQRGIISDRKSTQHESSISSESKTSEPHAGQLNTNQAHPTVPIDFIEHQTAMLEQQIEVVNKFLEGLLNVFELQLELQRSYYEHKKAEKKEAEKVDKEQNNNSYIPSDDVTHPIIENSKQNESVETKHDEISSNEQLPENISSPSSNTKISKSHNLCLENSTKSENTSQVKDKSSTMTTSESLRQKRIEHYSQLSSSTSLPSGNDLSNNKPEKD